MNSDRNREEGRGAEHLTMRASNQQAPSFMKKQDDEIHPRSYGEIEMKIIRRLSDLPPENPTSR